MIIIGIDPGTSTGFAVWDTYRRSRIAETAGAHALRDAQEACARHAAQIPELHLTERGCDGR